MALNRLVTVDASAAVAMANPATYTNLLPEVSISSGLSSSNTSALMPVEHQTLISDGKFERVNRLARFARINSPNCFTFPFE